MEYMLENKLSDYQKVLRNYDGMFDVYCCHDENKAKEFMNTKTFPNYFARVMIIDTSQHQELSPSKFVSPGTSYFKKYSTYIFDASTEKGMNEFIEKFMDDKLD